MKVAIYARVSTEERLGAAYAFIFELLQDNVGPGEIE